MEKSEEENKQRKKERKEKKNSNNNTTGSSKTDNSTHLNLQFKAEAGITLSIVIFYIGNVKYRYRSVKANGVLKEICKKIRR